MPSRQPRLQRIMLSPGVSIIIGAVGALLLLGQWWALLASVIMGAVMLTQIKVLTLFRGSNYPFIGLFMLLQASLTPDSAGLGVGLMGLLSLILLLNCFLSPENTRSFFFIYLLCGLGALFFRCFAFLAILLLVCMILIRAFSARGLMAAFLGFVTPAILVLPFALAHILRLKAIYTTWLVPGFTLPLLVVSSIAFLSIVATFLQSYGYPAQARARNMTILGMTLGSMVLTFVDSTHAAAYFALLNLGCAYSLTHLAAIKRLGWVPVALGWIVLIALVFYENCY